MQYLLQGLNILHAAKTEDIYAYLRWSTIFGTQCEYETKQSCHELAFQSDYPNIRKF